jgi:phospholipid-translocating ATPase
LKNFEVKQSVLENTNNLKVPLLGEKDEVGRAQQRLNARNKDHDDKKQDEPGFFAKLHESFSGPKVSTESRIIHFDQRVVPPSNFENIVRNQKYSILSLIPVVLYNQFRFFFNFFFLMIAVSQAVDALKVGFLFTYVGPLVFVLALTTVKEGYDDYKRYVRDKEANSQTYKVLKANNVKVDVPSSNLKVGDIIEVHANQRIPADLPSSTPQTNLKPYS